MSATEGQCTVIYDVINTSVLQVKDLSFSVGGRRLLDNVCFEAKCGELTIITGASGSGKTTLLALIAGYLKREKGTIDGVGTGVSFVFQSPYLVPAFNVLDNVSLPLLEMGVKRGECLFAAKKSLALTGIEDLSFKNVGDLSGGQAARVNLARALAQNKSVILLDEPTGSLDIANSEKVFALLRSIVRNHIVIVVTHQEELAKKYGDRNYVLDEGHMKLFSTVAPRLESVVDAGLRYKSRRLKPFLPLKICFSFVKKKPVLFAVSVFFVSLTLALLAISGQLAASGFKSILNSAYKVYNFQYCTLARVENRETEAGLNLTKYIRPSEAFLQSLPEEYGIQLCVPLNYFAGDSIRVLNREKTEYFDAVFEPDIGEHGQLIKGRNAHTYSEVVINKNLLDSSGYDLESFSNMKLSSVFRDTIFHEAGDNSTRDIVNLDLVFQVVGVALEDKGFNYPTAYYSYQGLYGHLNGIYLENASRAENRPFSLVDLLSEAKDDDVILNYRQYISSRDPLGLRDFLGRDFKVESKAFRLIESSKLIVKSLSEVSFIFLLLVLIGAGLLEFTVVKIFYEEERRTMALFRSFGIKKANFRKIFFGLAKIFGIASSITSYLISTAVVAAADSFLKHSEIGISLYSVNMRSTLLLFALSFLLSYAASLLPLKDVSTTDIIDCLKEE